MLPLHHIPGFVLRAGVEPARVAPLVFETSASTDSAIGAFAGAKVSIYGAKITLFRAYLALFNDLNGLN